MLVWQIAAFIMAHCFGIWAGRRRSWRRAISFIVGWPIAIGASVALAVVASAVENLSIEASLRYILAIGTFWFPLAFLWGWKASD